VLVEYVVDEIRDDSTVLPQLKNDSRYERTLRDVHQT